MLRYDISQNFIQSHVLLSTPIRPALMKNSLSAHFPLEIELQNIDLMAGSLLIGIRKRRIYILALWQRS